MRDQQSLRSACAYAQSDQSLCLSREYSISVKLLTEQHLEFLSLTEGCTGSSESTLVKMPYCWKPRVAARLIYSTRNYTPDRFSWTPITMGVVETVCYPNRCKTLTISLLKRLVIVSTECTRRNHLLHPVSFHMK